jgi:hypothetical protein
MPWPTLSPKAKSAPVAMTGGPPKTTSRVSAGPARRARRGEAAGDGRRQIAEPKAYRSGARGVVECGHDGLLPVDVRLAPNLRCPHQRACRVLTTESLRRPTTRPIRPPTERRAVGTRENWRAKRVSGGPRRLCVGRRPSLSNILLGWAGTNSPSGAFRKFIGYVDDRHRNTVFPFQRMYLFRK